MHRHKSVFITVGTTKFPKLIDKITTKPVVDTLRKLGYDFVQLQTGKDFKGPMVDPQLQQATTTKENDSVLVKIGSNIFKYDSYFEYLEEEIVKADLVISHAGAGTCLEVLRNNKPLVVVVNEDLMDNHQMELAEHLQDNGYLYFCTCDTLVETLLKKDFNLLKPYPKPNKNLFPNYLNRCCGFIE